ncbi:hypothetical protein TNCV_2437421 [Trichonephila clavipes]|nr:hypothetical protein TNCV_2437421 [Trichonephila clavipes]
MPKEVEELVFVWASRLSPYPWVRFDYPFPFVIRSKIGENYSVCSSRYKTLSLRSVTFELFNLEILQSGAIDSETFPVVLKGERGLKYNYLA